MSTFPIQEMQVSRPVGVSFDADRFTVELSDGRALAVPYAYSPRLMAATPAQREHYELSPSGIHWPLIDGTGSASRASGARMTKREKSELGRLLQSLCKTKAGDSNGGRPRSNAPRCGCGLMTARLAVIRRHVCARETEGSDHG